MLINARTRSLEVCSLSSSCREGAMMGARCWMNERSGIRISGVQRND